METLGYILENEAVEGAEEHADRVGAHEEHDAPIFEEEGRVGNEGGEEGFGSLHAITLLKVH